MFNKNLNKQKINMKINSIRIYKIIKMRKLCKINFLINKVLSKKLLKSSIF